MEKAIIPLFVRYTGLRERLEHVPLCELPTPAQRLDRLGARLGITNLYMKRDDISARAYGGNKPRKLEFLLGDALRSGASHVITIGAAGSNHALATAIYAQQVGLKSISMLMPQPNARYVERNLLMELGSGAELHCCGTGLHSPMNMQLVYAATMIKTTRHRLRSGRSPRMIPPGGSSPIGTIGFVNAALELADQVARGELPEPDYVYVACGTLGTAAGLILGLRAAGLSSRVVAVKVVTGPFVGPAKMIRLIEMTNHLLHSSDAGFPELLFSAADFDFRDEWCGKQYALFTREGMEAVRLIEESEGIQLDGTYTGKTLAALVDDARRGKLRDKSVLFWNTLNSRDFSDSILDADYRNLPRCFHRYFEEPPQPLDRD